MKKTYLVRRNALLSGRISVGAVALVLALVVFAVRFLAPDTFWRAAAPVFGAASVVQADTHSLLASFRSAARLAGEVEALQSQNAALVSDNQMLSKKAEHLSLLLGAGEAPVAGILAGVLARPPESPYDTLLLAAGTRDGVAVDQEVFAGGGVPIGVVSAVTLETCWVSLFSTSGRATAGWVGKDIPISVIGGGGGTLRAQVSREAGVVVGDTVFVPGPGMLPVGTVARIEDTPSLQSVTLHIASMANLFSLAWVEIRPRGLLPSVASTTPS